MSKGTVLLCLLLSLNAWSLDKSTLDIRESRDELSKSGSLNSTTFGHRFLSTDFLEMSLMTGGAFTLGTSNGLSAGPFDDQAPLSFGHPYALTSYPLVACDGQWKRLDQWFSDWEQIAPQAAGGHLFVDAVLNGQLHINFALQPLDNGRAMTATLTAENLDGAVHTLGLGLVYDPAMGPGGDGFATFGGQVIKTPTLITAASALSAFTLSERPQAPLGLTLAVTADANRPDRALVDNWPEIYNDNSVSLPANPTAALFDACLKLIWDEKSLAAGEKRTAVIRFALTPPDFSSAAFIRWDMPSALTLENNLLFPRKLATTARVLNTGGGLDNLQLGVTFPKELSGTESSAPFLLTAGSSAFLPVQVNSKEIYEDKIVPVTLTVHRGAEIMDQLLRYVYIPATPVSDVGLTVTIDSVAIAQHPQVSMVMRAEVTETGAKLLSLQPENVFLYENDRRIPEFEMKKFGGGATMADVCFVLDVSGSMGDNITQVRNNIVEFADSLAARGFDYRIAVVAFCDYVDDRWTRDFTNDIGAVSRNLATIILWGGTEDSPGAMQYAADNLSWRNGSKRTIIWVTDEPYPENIQKRPSLINTLLAKGITVHGVGPLELQTEWFNPIVQPTGGNFYNIYGNFRDILLDVSRQKAQDRYLLTYTSQVSRADLHIVSIQVRYAGLGGQAQHTFSGLTGAAGILSCFPNPFNPTVTLRVQPFEGRRGNLEIYNVLGQRVRSFDVPPSTFTDIVWDARDDRGFPVSAGLYVVTFSLDAQKSAEQQKQRILYLK